MTLVLVVPTFPKLSETFIASKFLALLDEGWDVHVVCQRSPESEWRRFPALRERPELRRRVHSAWPHRPRFLAILLWPLALIRCLTRAPGTTVRFLRRGMKQFGVDGLRHLYLDAEIVCLRPRLIHFEFGALAVDRTHLEDLLGCRIGVSFRGYDLNHAGLEQSDYYGAVWRKAAALHLLSDDLWQKARRRGCPEDKAHVLIPPAVAPAFAEAPRRRHLETAGTLERPLRILAVGRLDWQKGYEYALQAVRRLVDRGLCIEYRIVGDGPYIGTVAFACHQMEIETVVKLEGALDSDGVREQMGQADVLLHAAVSEGFCNAVLEAQALGLPVVATDAGGLPENVVEGVTGYLVARRDPEALAERLERLAGDPTLRQKMGDAGRRRVREHFTLREQASCFDRWYRGLLDQRSAA
ncbi:MAG: colanic acid biosynthesis glycosyltransferase WcaL [bacterium]|nr:colanic acid biosynthesis glycosyltransferase WcaL [bacterium]